MTVHVQIYVLCWSCAYLSVLINYPLVKLESSEILTPLCNLVKHHKVCRQLTKIISTRLLLQYILDYSTLPLDYKWEVCKQSPHQIRLYAPHLRFQLVCVKSLKKYDWKNFEWVLWNGYFVIYSIWSHQEVLYLQRSHTKIASSSSMHNLGVWCKNMQAVEKLQIRLQYDFSCAYGVDVCETSRHYLIWWFTTGCVCDDSCHHHIFGLCKSLLFHVSLIHVYISNI